MTQYFNLKFCFKLLSLILLCVASVRCAGSNISKTVSPRIIGGVLATTTQLSYMVNIREKKFFFCGGSLISDTHVLTAAHCLKGKTESTLTVYTGTYLNKNEVWRSVKTMWVNPYFNFDSMNNDVAVIKLAAPIPKIYGTPIALCSTALKVGWTLQVSGWGLTNENVNKVSNQLRTVNVTITDKSKCIENYRGKITLQDQMFCASVPGKTDACTGDSGGPLVLKGSTLEQCGIVSFGIGCGRSAYPGVYTSVLKLKKWISSCMKL